MTRSARSESIASMLAQGRGRIAVGRAEEVAALVKAEPKLFSKLMECLWDDDPGVANRAAHALERLTRDAEPVPLSRLNRWKPRVLGLLADASENKMRWHLALVVPRMNLTNAECVRAAAGLTTWLESDNSSIVKTMCLQGLADLARKDASLLPKVLDLLRLSSRSGAAAMRARSRILLAEFGDRMDS